VAHAFFAESLTFRRALGDRQELAHLLLYLAVTASVEEAKDAVQAALAEARSLLPHARSVATARAAARLLGAAEAFRDPRDATLWPAERAARARAVPALRAALGEAAFAAAVAEGQALAIEQAIEEARRLAI
jgi:hypothetical protein